MSKVIKKNISLLVSLILTITLLSIGIGKLVEGGTLGEATFTPILSVHIGEGSSEVMVLKQEGSNPKGPEGFFVSNVGKIYLLDSVGKRIMIYNNGVLEDIIPISFTLYPRNITVSGNVIFVQDSDENIYALNNKGEVKKIFKLPFGVGSLDVLNLHPQHNSSLTLWLVNNFEFGINELPRNLDLKDIKGNKLARGLKRIDGIKFISEYLGVRDGVVRSIDNKVIIPIQASLGAFGSAKIVSFDQNNNIYLLIEELGNTYPQVSLELTLRSYNKDGKATGIARLPLEEMSMIPNKIVDINQRGEVFILVPKNAELVICKVELGRKFTSQINRWSVSKGSSNAIKDHSINFQSTTSSVVYGGFKGYPISQTRASVRNRAWQMINFSWTWRNRYDFLPNGTPRPGGDATKPNQLKNLSEGAGVVGIPYTWGGWDSPWTWSDGQPWRSFAESLSYYTTFGPLVGNISTTWYSGSSGIDCSGFAAAASDTYYIGNTGGITYCKPGVSHLHRDGKSVSNTIGGTDSTTNWSAWSGLQPMDFFTRTTSPSHVTMYNFRLLDGSGISTLESTTSIGYSGFSSPSQGAKSYRFRWVDLNGYYHKSWWDRQTGDDFNLAFNSPNTLSEIQGQQIYYTWIANSTGNKTVNVTAITGDPDLYVYDHNFNFLAKSDVWGSDSISFPTQNGQRYYFKVHIWSSGSYTISY